MDEAARLGHPLARPLLLHDADDAAARAVDDEFLLGDELLAAPAFSESANATRDVYLPAGAVWVHLWTGAAVDCSQGPTRVLGAPLARLK